MSPERRLLDAGLVVPEPGVPAFDYEPFVSHDGVIWLAGQLAKETDGEVARLGRVGVEVDEAEAARQMRLAALHALGWLKRAAGGDLDGVARILQLNAWVACGIDFDGISRLADSASGVFVTAFGETGRHPRSVLGVARLPRNAPVMIDLRAALRKPAGAER